MYLFFLLASIIGILTLIGFLIIFAYKLIQDKKNPYSWFTLTIVIFFLGLAIWQSLSFIGIL